LFYSLVRLTISGPVQRLLGIRDYAEIGGWHWQYTTFGITVLGIVTLVIFARDLIRDRSEKQRLAAELAASRAVQQVLIPEQLPTVPGSGFKPSTSLLERSVETFFRFFPCLMAQC
jgi:hypothetical protein